MIPTHRHLKLFYRPQHLTKYTARTFFWQPQDNKDKKALPDTRLWYEKYYSWFRYEFLTQSYFTSIYDKIRYGLGAEAKPKTWLDELKARTIYSKPPSFLTGPLASIKWFAIKCVLFLFGLKIFFANLHLLYTYRPQQQPVTIVQQPVS